MKIPEKIPAAQSSFASRPCSQIDYTFGHQPNLTLLVYPECNSYYTGPNPNAHALVAAKVDSVNPMEIAAFLGTAFGIAFAVALPLHALLVEVYVRI